MQEQVSNIVYDPHGVGYSDNILMNSSPIHGNYNVRDGIKIIMSLAFRKQYQLSSITLPIGIMAIGDAAFSHCKALKHVVFPSSIIYIGVAAFCNSGLEEVGFLGIPKEVEKFVFKGCDQLRAIYIPEGTKEIFAKWFDVTLLKELKVGQGVRPLDPPKTRCPLKSKAPARELHDNKIVKRSYLGYNQTSFSWAADDDVKLSDLFCGQTPLNCDPTYLFRKKALFVFITSKTAQRTNLLHSSEYALAANASAFKRKYDDKYARFSSPVRIFIFVCDDNKHAKFYDEARLKKIVTNSIIVKSLIRY